MRKTARSMAAILLLLALLCGGLAGCTGARRSGGDVDIAQGAVVDAAEPSEDPADVETGLLRIGLTEAVGTMDVQRTTKDYMLPLNIYERLFDIRVNDDGSTALANGLAEDYSVSEDGLTYRFTLREDAFFSDGTPVRASDVAFTFTRMLALPDSVQTDFADMIRGADAVMAGEADALEGIRVLDDRRLEITLSEPFAGYIYQLATPSCSILSEACVTEAGGAYGSLPENTIGSGPYRVTEFSKDRIALEQNPYYHCHEGEELSARRVEIRVLAPALMDRTFRAGGLDILDTNLVNPDVVESVYKSDAWKDRIISHSRVEVQYLMLNVAERPTDDVRVRRAIQMAIDRQRILDELYDGDGTLLDGIYPKGLIGYSEENQGWLRYDPEAAAQLVREAGGAGDVRLELAANSQDSVRSLTMLEMIRQDLNEIGLNASIISYDDESRMYLRRAGRLTAYTSDWSADFNDPDNFIYTFFGSRDKTRARSGNYADETVIGRIAAARTLQDEEERLAEYADLERILVRDEAVWVPLFSTDHLFVLGSRVESFTPFWAGWSSMYFRDVVLKPQAR